MTTNNPTPVPSTSTTVQFVSVPSPREEEKMPTVGQRKARAKKNARPGRTPDPVGAQARVESYAPTTWSAAPFMPLTRNLALKARPVDPQDAGELLTALSLFAGWLDTIGVPLTAATLVDEMQIQRFVLDGCSHMKAGTAANYRSRLLRVRRAVMGDDRPAPLHASDPTEPYAEPTEDVLVQWCAGAPSDRARADLLAAAALGLGAGLTAAEIPLVKGKHVIEAYGAVAVRALGDRTRLVPVRDAYRHLLVGLAQDVGPLGFLFLPGGRNGLSNLVDRTRKGGDLNLPRLNAQRMRATWLVRHLDAGVRADALLVAAGLDDLGSLDRYLRWCRPVTKADVLGLVGEDGA